MNEIDLIPNEYRYWQWQKRYLKTFGLLAMCTTLLLGAVAAGFHWQGEATKPKLAKLQNEKLISIRQQKRLESLAEDRKRFDRQWLLLNGLRGGTSVGSLFSVIDQTLQDEQVWFDEWKFQRAGEAVVSEQVIPERGTYIILVNQQTDTGEGTQAWGIDTHLKIRGGAIDHSAFSNFVQNLLLQKYIADVRILSTSSADSSQESNSISFEIAILIHGDPEGIHSA